VRVLLDVFADSEGHLQGWLRGTKGIDPVPFDGVLELLAALEHLGPEPLIDRAPDSKGDQP
jgi:hypothetical protein